MKRTTSYFDVNFKTGGSDRQFFLSAMAAGCRFIAVEEAPVYEVVPPERWKRRYYLKRALVNGFNVTRYREDDTRRLSTVAVAARSCLAIWIYSLIALFGGFPGGHVQMRYLEKICYHVSRLAGMMGIELVKRRDF